MNNAHLGAEEHRRQSLSTHARAQVDGLVALALRGLPTAYQPEPLAHAQTVRAVRLPAGVAVRAEGTSLRYAAIAALGLGAVSEEAQLDSLGGRTAHELARSVADRAQQERDPGAVALAAWAVAEVSGRPDASLLGRIEARLTDERPLPTIVTAWMLTAALASETATVALPAPAAASAAVIRSVARDRLIAAQGAHGIFPHALPAASLSRWRAHVGCFADQVYPIQALSRLVAATGDAAALTAAETCAAQICDLQGDAGQWWWHYDVRDGTVVERYPVYSVHQHAMGPMALHELAEAGGTRHDHAVELGLSWLETHPEVLEDLVSERHGLVWRKVGRRDRRKAVRKIAAVATALAPGRRPPGLDLLFPATEVDHECRPYELGWLLYAWTSRSGPQPALVARRDEERAPADWNGERP